jgi:UDP-N-acetylglucosamine:LPS N-acetylglucosamine transferase
MVQAGAAVMLEESELRRPEVLAETIAGLFSDRHRLARMSSRARTQAHPDAAAAIANRLVRLAGS